jgi:GNAT superfamily N-acetyltransferase
VSSYEIFEVQNKSDLKEFIKFPLKLYNKEPYYVPHIFLERLLFFNEKLNPFFKHAKVKNFIVKRNRETCGRISAIIDYVHNEFHNEKVCFFGNLDLVNSIDVATALFEKVEKFAKQEDMSLIRGPMNFSTNHECGLLVKGFDSPPKIMMTHNFPYYRELVEGNGFYKAKDLFAYMLDTEKMDMSRLNKASNTLKKRYNVVTRKINLKKFKEELNIIYNVYNSAWEKNWGFVPMDKEEFFHSSGMLKYFADDDLILIAEVDTEPVGFIVALPDINKILIDLKGRILPFGIFKLLLNKKNIKELRIITLGLKEEFRNKGIDYILIAEVVKNSKRKGIRFGECSWILEDNLKMNNALKKLNGEIYKVYRIYEREV